jgi:cytosine/creatinine deaminase
VAAIGQWPHPVNERTRYYLDPDPGAAIDACLEAAADHARPVDLHTDETLDPSVLTLATLADAVLASGFAQPVAAQTS